MQHRQNPPAVPCRHLPRDPEPGERVAGSARGPGSPLWGMLLSWMRPRCRMWVGRDEPENLSMGLAAFLVFVGRPLCLNGAFLPRLGGVDALECLIFPLLYFSRKT